MKINFLLENLNLCAYFRKSRILTHFACINFRELAEKFAKFAKKGHARICTLEVINQRKLSLGKHK